MNNLSQRELIEWIEFYKVNPFGFERFDYLAGIIASTIANVNRSKGSKIYKPEDFIPRFSQKAEDKQDWRKMKIASMLWTMVFQSQHKQ